MTPSPVRLARLVIASASLVLALGALATGPLRTPHARADDPPKKDGAAKPGAPALPPLEIDDDAPRLSDAPAKAATAPADPKAADNSACQVCHTNYRKESLATSHAAHGVGCVRCHGASEAHRNDENNITPPDTMIPLAKLDQACKKCHLRHNVAARKVVERFLERKLSPAAAENLVCTECHGEHRLAHRTVVWDRATGKLMTRSAPVAPK